MNKPPDIEREIKVLDINVHALLAKLTSLDAVKKYDTKMHIVSYDFVPGKLSLYQNIDTSFPPEMNEVLAAAAAYYEAHGSLIQNNAHLRLRYRDNDDEVEFCFKHNTGNQGDHKVAYEYNATISRKMAASFEQMTPLVGLQEVAIHDKKRTSYILPQNDCICDIDTYPGLPTYVEIEHSHQETIDAMIKLLGLSNYARSTKSGQEFFKTYGIDYYSTLTF